MSSLEGLRLKPKKKTIERHDLEGLRLKPKKEAVVETEEIDYSPKEEPGIMSNLFKPQYEHLIEAAEPLYNNNFTKGFLSGVGRAAMSEAADQAGAGVMEVAPGVVVPISESSAMANIPEKGLEVLESMKPDENDTLGNIAYKAGEFGGATASMPMFPVRGAVNAAANTGRSMLSRFGKEAAMGSAIGGGSGVLQETTGIDPFYADLIASVAVPGALSNSQGMFGRFSNPKEKLAKGAMRVMGLNKRKTGGFDVPAAQAAKDLEIDLPAAALTDSAVTGLADQWISKSPFFGNKLRNKYLTVEEQTRKALDDIYSQSGPKRTPELETKINEAYTASREGLPVELDKRSVVPKNTSVTTNSLYGQLANSDVFAKDTKQLLTILKNLKKNLGSTSNKVDRYGATYPSNDKYDVKKLINAKMNLNAMIKWDTDEGIKNLARKLQKAVSEDISEYGKINPEWHKNYREADKLYGNLAKRERVEEMLGQKATNYATDGLSYNTLAKSIRNPNTAEILQKQVTPEIFAKIQKLGEVARAMAAKNSRIPNPSGTAATLGVSTGVLGLIGLVNHPDLTTGLLTAGGTGAAMATVTGLLTNKKFLDLALDYAEKPTLPKEISLNKFIMDKTGYSAVALRNKLLDETNNDDK